MPQETPAEMNALLEIHNSDKLFDNFSFVNESNIIKTTDHSTIQTDLSQGNVGRVRKNSFDEETPLELDSLPGDQSGSQASDEDLKNRPKKMFEAELETKE